MKATGEDENHLEWEGPADGPAPPMPPVEGE